MRIRMKISYHAWARRITVKQLLLEQIMSSFVTLYSKRLNLQAFNIDEFTKEVGTVTMIKKIIQYNQEYTDDILISGNRRLVRRRTMSDRE